MIVLEFNFELIPKKAVVPDSTITIDISEPSTYRIIPQSKPIAATKPVVTQPKFIEIFKETTKEIPKDIVKPVETIPNKENSEHEAPKQAESENQKTIIDSNPVTSSPFNVEELPMFPACKGLNRAEQLKCFEEQMRKKVAKNLIYPDEDFNNGKQGRTYISFVIDEFGKIVEVKAEDNNNATLEMQKAAEKAVRQVSKLLPAKQGGKPVRIKYTVPVTFKIQ